VTWYPWEVKELRETREYDLSEDSEKKGRRLTPEERDEIIREYHDKLSKIKPSLEGENIGKINARERNLNSRIETYDEFQEVLQRNPSFMERMDAKKELREIAGYFRMKDDKITGRIPEGVQRKELAVHYGIPDSSFNDWSYREVRPFGLRTLEKLEADRIDCEWKVPYEAQEHCIDCSLVYHSFKKFRFELLDFQQVASMIIGLDEQLPQNIRFYYTNLKPYSTLGMQWYRGVSDYIMRNQGEIQKKLDTNSLRIGIVNDTLYVHRCMSCIDSWTDIHAVDHFHFESSEAKNRIVENALLHLGGISRRDFGRLLNQFAEETRNVTQGSDRNELRKSSNYLTGETLGFILDVVGKDIHDVQSIRHISGFGAKRGRGNIENPKFPLDIEIIRAQLIGAMMSDGHLRPKMSAHYYEKDQVRLRRFKEIISQLGEIQYWESKREDGHVIGLPAVFGRMLAVWGMPIGDKSILNSDLPKVIKDGTNRVKQEYLSQLIAEDGSFSFKGGGWRFKWSRAVTLYSGKMEKYGLESRMGYSQQQFLIEHGERRTTDFKNPDSIKEEPTKQIVITKGELDNFMIDSEIATGALQFHNMIM